MVVEINPECVAAVIQPDERAIDFVCFDAVYGAFGPIGVENPCVTFEA